MFKTLKFEDMYSSVVAFRFKFCEDDENLKNETVVKYELVLRKWIDINPAHELRCFVRDNKLIGKLDFCEMFD